MWEPVLDRLREARVIDLAQPWRVGMPHYPTHPPYLYSLTKQHGEFTLPGGASSAADAIALGTHTGTHIDALGHFSCNGLLHGGRNVADMQSYAAGLQQKSIAEVGCILKRGVLLDITALSGVEALAEDFVISPDHLEQARARVGVELREGDIILVRTGWDAYWSDPARFINELRAPGVQRAGAEWLSRHRPFSVGADTAAFEFVPSPRMEVHVHLLVESGIHIMEALNLADLAGTGKADFLFVATPLRLEGATGSPIRPFAIML